MKEMTEEELYEVIKQVNNGSLVLADRMDAHDWLAYEKARLDMLPDEEQQEEIIYG